MNYLQNSALHFQTSKCSITVAVAITVARECVYNFCTICYFPQKLANVKYNFPWSKKCQTVFFVHHTKHNNIITKILKETFFILKTKKMLVNIMLEINTNYFGRCPNGGDPLPKLFGPISPSDISIDLEPNYFIKIVIFTQF